MSADVVVIGAGGFGRETLDVIEAHNEAIERGRRKGPALRVTGIVDDIPSQKKLKRLDIREYRYLGTTDEIIETMSPHNFVLAIGNPNTKISVDRKFVQAGWTAITVVHPAATIGSQCSFGEGNVVCSGAQISTNTKTGRHVHINPNATIGHDSRLEDYVSVNPGAVISGEVLVRQASLVGASSVILQGLEVGESCTIGASACVVKDVPPLMTMIGIPARPLKDKLAPLSRD